MNRIPKVLLSFVAAAATASLALASTKAELLLEKPVPATEQVPIVDFVRQTILSGRVSDKERTGER